MARRRRNRRGDNSEDVVKLVLVMLALFALAIGGVTGFAQAFVGLVTLILIIAVSAGLFALAVCVGIRLYRRFQARAAAIESSPDPADARQMSLPRRMSQPEPAPWNATRIRRALDEIDWYQFEEFCAALLEADGFSVQRKGGAHPDGGVDLLVEKDGAQGLIQCKHWRTWIVKERIVREMLGSMTHFKVSQGAIYTLKGWTEPAALLAAEHDITLVNGDELAQSASFQLSPVKLDLLLNPNSRHCPKCEAPMVWREGNFTPFWGCSTYPRCRGTLKYSGAR